MLKSIQQKTMVEKKSKPLLQHILGGGRAQDFIAPKSKKRKGKAGMSAAQSAKKKRKSAGVNASAKPNGEKKPSGNAGSSSKSARPKGKARKS